MRYLLSRSIITPLSGSAKRRFHSARYLLDVKPFLLADIGEGITECEVVQWFVKPGDTVEEFDKICEVQSDKASVEISSRYAGSILKLHYDANDIAKVGHPLVDIETSGDDAPSKIIEQVAEKASEQVAHQGYQALWQVPSVHRLLQEYHLEIGQINGTGKNNRVLKGDVLEFIKAKSLKKGISNLGIVPKATKKSQVKDEPSVTESTDRTVPLNAIQKAMFKAMTKSLSIPQLGYKDDINLNETQKYRESLNHYIAQKPDEYPFKKISYLPIFIKCMSLALTQYPILNAKVEEEGLRYRSSHNIGIAMDTPNGLLVPNIKNVQDKTIFQIASDIHRLLALGQQGKLGPNELRDGTITLSNIGTIGGTYANPVIVSSETAIVALGSIRKLPSYDGERTVPKHTLPISWSADHRVIDGATMARFSNVWKTLIENPALLASMLH